MMEPTLREDRKATQDALDAIDYMGIGPRFGIILEAISAARERGAREEREACAALVFPRHAEPAKGQYELRRDLAAALRARADK